MTPEEAKKEYDYWKKRKDDMIEEMVTAITLRYKPVMNKYWNIYTKDL